MDTARPSSQSGSLPGAAPTQVMNSFRGTLGQGGLAQAGFAQHDDDGPFPVVVCRAPPVRTESSRSRPSKGAAPASLPGPPRPPDGPCSFQVAAQRRSMPPGNWEGFLGWPAGRCRAGPPMAPTSTPGGLGRSRAAAMSDTAYFAESVHSVRGSRTPCR